MRKSYSRCEVIPVSASLRGYGGSLVVIVITVVTGVSALLALYFTGVSVLLGLVVTGATVPSELVVTGVAAASKYVEPPLGDSYSSSVITWNSFG